MATEQDESTNEDLYDAAIAETPKEEVKTEEAASERARNEKGQFTKAESPEPEITPEPVVEPVVQTPEKAEPHHVPLNVLLDEREKRQAEQRRVEQLQHQLQALQQQMQPPKVQEAPDQFQDPQGYNAYWEQRLQEQANQFQQQLRMHEANTSLRNSHLRHGEIFEKAYAALMEQGETDKVSVQNVINSPDPGEALVGWYKREQTLKLVGDDPNAFKERALEEALNDPAFLAKAIEKAKGVASTNPTQVKLPPSINKMASAASSHDESDMSPGALYRYATQR